MGIRILLIALSLTFSGIAPSMAQATIKHQLNISPQPVGSALAELARQAKIQVIYSTALVEGLESPEVKGDMTPEEALKQILPGSNLGFEFVDANTITLVALPEKKAASQKGSIPRELQLRLAQKGGSTTDPSSSTSKRGLENIPNPSDVTENTGGAKIDEIIVTATKRAQRLEDVPMSIAVIGSQDIERRGLIGMEDYLRSIPGVNQVDRGSVDNSIVIRGISTTAENEVFSIGSTTVATYFDETPITGAAGGVGVDVRPVDIERIELLRGPQGTSYGSSSLGGTLRIIPAKPKLGEFSGKVAAAYSNTSEAGGDNTMFQGVLNAPVGDTLALRAVAYRYEDSGFFQNVAGSDPATLAVAQTWGLTNYVSGYFQDDVGHMESVGGRVSGLWSPSDKLNLTLTYVTQTIEQDGAPEATVGRFQQARIPIVPSTRVRGEAGEVSDTQMDLASAVLNYDLGWGTLTTVGSWVDGEAIFARDFTYALGRPTTSIQLTNSNTLSGEARIASQLHGPLQFLVGVYYEKTDYTFYQTVDWPGTAASNPYGTTPILLSTRDRNLDQKAIFGEVSYDLTEKLTATVGGRLFKYDRNELALREGGFANVAIGAGTPTFLTTQESNQSYKANLSYEPTKNSMVYLSWAEGFRLGRPDIGLAVCDTTPRDGIVDGTTLSVASTQNIASDFLENYELGNKFTLLDRRIAVDASVFHIKWDGMPMRATLPPGSPCGLAYTPNIGQATSDGVELQTSISVTPQLRVDVGGSYTKAQLSKDAPILLPPAFDGDRLPGSPEVNFNLAAQYDFTVAGHKAFVRADSFYTGEFYGNLQQTAITEAGDYVKVDTRAGVAINNLSVEVYVRNLTDEDAFTWRGLSSRGQNYFGYLVRPRTIGLQLGYSFE